jgi:D-proline reductase (dithiol) PrdB
LGGVEVTGDLAAMTSERGDEFGFAPAHDRPIAYMQRIRDYYAALGYGAPYQWAHYAEVPFRPLRKPLAQCRVTIVTTAAPYQPGKGDQGPGAPYNAAAKFYAVYSSDTAQDHDLRISHIAIDRTHTTAEDSSTWFPLPALRGAAARGLIGSVAPRFHGLPTNRSHRTTLDIDCPELVERCLADAVDAAILVANCPVCHQSVSLAARALEARGIATVVMGCAKDIVEHVGVPRFVFSDFPLGNAAGRPNDAASQAATLELALAVLETAPAARTTVQSPLVWGADAAWKGDYQNAARLSPEEIARRRAEFDRGKDVAKDVARTLREQVDKPDKRQGG